MLLENFNEPAIRGWFSQFGPLNQVTIDHTWGKAILIYADYDSAAKAWNDPRPVFSNRFVKIWWKKTPHTTTPPLPTAGNGHLSGAIVDQVELEIARETAMKAQREHEEKQKRKEELERKKGELERQRVELVDRQKKEREKLMEKIRRAEERAKEKSMEVGKVASVSASPQEVQKDVSVTPVPEDVPKKETTNGAAVTSEQQTEEPSERKAQLQKMLTDLQNQVPPRSSTITPFNSQAKALNIPPQNTPSRPCPTPAPKPSAAPTAVVPTPPVPAAAEAAVHPDP